MSTGKVSFTIRRPSPISRASSSDAESFKVPSLPRHLSTNGNGTSSPLVRSTTNSPKPNSRTYHDRESDSSDEGDRSEDELVTGFDRFGVQRLKEKKPQQGPLIIAPLQNKDWRDLAKKRKNANRYVPASASAVTGKDGSVGGLGTKDTINSGPVIAGLQVKQKRFKVEVDVDMDASGKEEEVEVVEETEDQRAIRALLAGTDPTTDGPLIDIIPPPITETDAYKQDVEELPDQATLDDYARVPVSQFGAALLRGMGWKEGTAATRNGRKGMVEPWTPTARPALLGIGAKEREVFDDGSARKGGPGKGGGRPERRYVPVIKKEREGSERGEGTGSASGSSSRRRSPEPRRGESLVPRRGSRSPSPSHSRSRYRDDSKYERKGRGDYDDKDRDGERQKDRDRRRDSDRDRERRRDRPE